MAPHAEGEVGAADAGRVGQHRRGNRVQPDAHPAEEEKSARLDEFTAHLREHSVPGSALTQRWYQGERDPVYTGRRR
jgi:hypothetical protein